MCMFQYSRNIRSKGQYHLFRIQSMLSNKRWGLCRRWESHPGHCNVQHFLWQAEKLMWFCIISIMAFMEMCKGDEILMQRGITQLLFNYNSFPQDSEEAVLTYITYFITVLSLVFIGFTLLLWISLLLQSKTNQAFSLLALRSMWASVVYLKEAFN